MPINNTGRLVGQLIKRLMAEQSWSWHQTAEKLGVSIATLQRVRTEGGINLSTLDRVAMNLSLSTREFLEQHEEWGAGSRYVERLMTRLTQGEAERLIEVIDALRKEAGGKAASRAIAHLETYLAFLDE